MLYMQVDPWAQ